MISHASWLSHGCPLLFEVIRLFLLSGPQPLDMDIDKRVNFFHFWLSTIPTILLRICKKVIYFCSPLTHLTISFLLLPLELLTK